MEWRDEEQKVLYGKCKYAVKVWEHEFKKKNGRLPSKLDIKESDQSVRNAYKTYFHLKTAAIEQSFKDVDGFNSDEEQFISKETHEDSNSQKSTTKENEASGPGSTWGPDLNKRNVKNVTADNPLQPVENLNLKISRKISLGTKIIKRNPRKCLSQTKSEPVISTSDLPVNTTESIPFSEVEQINQFNINSSQTNFFQMTKTFSRNSSLPINIVQNMVSEHSENNLKHKDINVQWLEYIDRSVTNLEVTKSESVSDEDVIDNSDGELQSDDFHIVKKIKLNVNDILNKKTNNVSLHTTSNELEKKIISVNNTDNIKDVTDSSLIQNFEGKTTDPLDNNERNRESKEATTSKFGTSDKMDSSSNTKPKYNKMNENFVKINIQKKVYARGKKTQNFSKYKKKMWRNKKQMLSQDDNEEHCQTKLNFNSDKLLSLETYEALTKNEETLLTVNEVISGTDLNSEYKHESTELKEDNINLVQEQRILSAIEKEDCLTQPESVQQLSKKPVKKRTKKNEVQVTPKSKIDKLNKNVTQKQKIKETSKSEKNLNKNKNKQKVKSKRTSKLSTSSDDSIVNSETLTSTNRSIVDSDEEMIMEMTRLEHNLILKEVHPLYKLKENGELIDTPSEVFETLKLFGHNSFRDGQEKAIMRILSGQSTLLTLSTGSGKSLCYQIPAYLFRQKYNCMTLVISPLISLMEDQIKCMPVMLKAACLHGNQSKTVRDSILKAVTSGKIGILMVSPESILSIENQSGLGLFSDQLPPIAFACLDEAHCLSQWSHNFRPSYLMVCKILKETLGVKTILGLTATATKTTKDSLINQLEIPDGENGVLQDKPIPSNLILSVSRDFNKDRGLLDLLLSEPYVKFESIIIYCLRRNDCEKVATFLRTTMKDQLSTSQGNTKKRKRISLQAEAYHAGLSAAKRKSIQNAFMSGELRIVVATIAFGMGINKYNIRSVIHYNMPSKFETFVQEIGRAGRDGLPANCHVFLDRQNKDISELRRHIYANTVDRNTVRKLLHKVFIPCSCTGNCFNHEVMFSIDSTVQSLDVPVEVISTLLCYLELHKNNYIKVLKPSYGFCKVVAYGNFTLIKNAALECEPLKVALEITEIDEKVNSIEFSILDVAKKLNHTSGMLKRILKNLEWTNINGQPKRSSLNVEFSNLSFHLMSPGNLPDDVLDEILDELYKKVLQQENLSYAQLIQINDTLIKASSSTYKEHGNMEKSDMLKNSIRLYFENEKVVEKIVIPDLPNETRDVVISDIRQLISRYSDETFNGRSIARIFHGISSPNFPAFMWGRTKFWRSHLQVHFNHICKLASEELMKL